MNNPKICDLSKSEDANVLYRKIRYVYFEDCSNPCKRMKIHLNYQTRKPKHHHYVRFHMEPIIASDEHVLAYTSLNLFAEIGSYLGLTLGLSLMSLQWILNSSGKFFFHFVVGLINASVNEFYFAYFLLSHHTLKMVTLNSPRSKERSQQSCM